MSRGTLRTRYWSALTGQSLARLPMPPRAQTGYSFRRRYVASLLGIPLRPAEFRARPAKPRSRPATSPAQPAEFKARPVKGRATYRAPVRRRPPLMALASFATVMAVIVLIAVFLYDRPGSDGSVAQTTSKPPQPTAGTNPATASTRPSPPRATTTARPGTVNKAVPVRVLNNSTVSGLSAIAVNDFSADGWTAAVDGGEYAAEKIITSTAYFRPNTAEEAAAYALATKFNLRTDTRLPFLAAYADGVIVVVTNDYGGK